ncbi:MAG: 2-oxoacid:acceptor oxidoreductase family protein [Eggerthellaceae bacterium]|nr:2-oxoacid:acceptor oxidoreductase family protein [Eggerthellaceae bacterium]
MIEVLWHGRGGQGAFTAARLLGAAASMRDGAYALAFPSFGPERRGAPMRAFTKIDDSAIGDRSAIKRADFVVYLDDTLLDASDDAWARELKPSGRVLVNSVRRFADPRIVALDANGISAEILGRPIPNTVFLGALSVLCDAVRVEDVVEAIHQYMPAKLHEKNERIVEAAREQLLAERSNALTSAPCESVGADVDACPSTDTAENAENVSRETLQAENVGGTTETVGQDAAASAAAPAIDADVSRETSDVVRSCAHIPVLRSHLAEPPSLDPADYARTTCYPAGHLVAKNAGWRNERPVVSAAACTGCLQCYLYCPDGAVFKTSDDATAVEIDYDFCKGCGICVKACKFNAIGMIPESEALAAAAQHAAVAQPAACASESEVSAR